MLIYIAPNHILYQCFVYYFVYEPPGESNEKVDVDLGGLG